MELTPALSLGERAGVRAGVNLTPLGISSDIRRPELVMPRSCPAVARISNLLYRAVSPDSIRQTARSLGVAGALRDLRIGNPRYSRLETRATSAVAGQDWGITARTRNSL